VKLFGVLDLDKRDRQVGYYNLVFELTPGQNPETTFDLFTGRGLQKSLAEAYEFLLEKYEPGDRVFLFGAGFGGLIASGLGNLLELVGVLRPENRAAIGAVLELAREPPERARGLAEGLKATLPHQCSPYFLGVWDTLTQTTLLR